MKSCILVKFLNVIKRVHIGKDMIKRSVNKQYSLHKNLLQHAELSTNDVLLKQNVCHLLAFKLSESDT